MNREDIKTLIKEAGRKIIYYDRDLSAPKIVIADYREKGVKLFSEDNAFLGYQPTLLVLKSEVENISKLSIFEIDKNRYQAVQIDTDSEYLYSIDIAKI